MLFLVLLAMPTALAEEEVVLLDTHSIMGEPVLEQHNSVALFSDAQWDSTHTSYYDQLSAEEKAVYDKVLEIQTAFAQNMEEFDLTDPSGPMHRTAIEYPVYDDEGNPLADENGVPLVVQYEYWRINDVVEETRPYKAETFESWYYEKGDSVMRACQALAFDHPEFFWIRQGVAWFSGDDEDVLYIVDGNVTTHLDAGFIAYPMSDTAEECIELQAQLDEVVGEILDELGKPEYTNVEAKLAYMDNWLAEHNHYNEAAAVDSTWIYRDETPWSIVSGLLDEYNPVCEGYAKAFQLICHELGIPCLQVSGEAYQVKDDGTLGSGGAHMWTAVKLDKFWFVCDPTWDDPLYGAGVDKDFSCRKYFLVNQPAGHFVGMQFVTPNCGAFTVNFDANGRGTAPETQTVPYGESAVEPETLTAEGYTFGGWYTDAVCTELWDFATEVTQNVTLYAKWTINTYTVSFDANGHGTAPEVQNVNWNETAVEPQALIAEGHTFGGWYTDAVCTEQWNFDTAITADVTVYAKWTINTYTVSFDANGHGTAPEVQSIVWKETATEPEALTAEGHTFDGWYTDAAGTEKWDFTTAVTESMTLYAKWTINTYTVSFNANGHGTAPNTQTIAWNEMATEPEAPTEKNCGFDGWYIDAECTTPWDFTSAVTADVTLYAKWIEYGFDNVAVDRIVAELTNAQEGDVVDTDTWECAEDGISGLEVGTGTMMMALYKEKKMLGIVECQVVYQDWNGSGWNVYTVSGVDLELLAQADEVIRFNINSSYVPIGGSRAVK